MKFAHFYATILTLTLMPSLTFPIRPYAQEVTAASTYKAQDKFLSNRVEILRNLLSEALKEIQNIKNCNNQGKIYAPDKPVGENVDENHCFDISVKAASLSIFTISAGFDAGQSMTVRYDLKNGTYTIPSSATHGKQTVNVPKLDYDLLCNSKTKYDISLLTANVWWGMPLSPNKDLDKTMSISMPQTPSCQNKLIGIITIYDDSPTLINDNWSTGGVILMQAVPKE